MQLLLNLLIILAIISWVVVIIIRTFRCQSHQLLVMFTTLSRKKKLRRHLHKSVGLQLVSVR